MNEWANRSYQSSDGSSSSHDTLDEKRTLLIIPVRRWWWPEKKVIFCCCPQLLDDQRRDLKLQASECFNDKRREKKEVYLRWLHKVQWIVSFPLVRCVIFPGPLWESYSRRLLLLREKERKKRKVKAGSEEGRLFSSKNKKLLKKNWERYLYASVRSFAHSFIQDTLLHLFLLHFSVRELLVWFLPLNSCFHSKSKWYREEEGKREIWRRGGGGNWFAKIISIFTRRKGRRRK